MAAAWRSMLATYLKSEYFLLNVTILATYLLFRLRHLSSQVHIKAPFAASQYQFATFHSARFPDLERQVGITLLVTLGARVYRSTSASASVSTLLAYLQLFVLVITVLTDWVVAVYYLLAFGLVFLLVEEAAYAGDDKVETLHAASFTDKCLGSSSSGGAGSSSAGDGVAHVVFLHTSWSSKCRHAYPLFAELSNRYATDKLCFARLDVGTWPRVARQLGVDISTVSSQLPSVVLFENGQEVARVPAAKAAVGRGAKYTFSKMDLIRGLQLDARFAQSMNKQS